MLDLINGDEVCFWTNGYTEDQARLVDFMKEKHQLHPHQLQRQNEIDDKLEWEEKELRKIASTTKLPKTIRKALLERKS